MNLSAENIGAIRDLVRSGHPLEARDAKDLLGHNDHLVELLEARCRLMLGVEIERDQLKAENEIFEEGLRSLASTLGAGGYNAATLTATQLVDKVQWGVDHLAETSGRQIDALRAEVSGLKTGYEAYERVKAELKAENEALRKDDLRAGLMALAAYIGPICTKAVVAAMGKGEQS